MTVGLLDLDRTGFPNLALMKLSAWHAETPNHYGQSLTVEVLDGRLVISIGVNVLANAVAYAEWANRWDIENYVREFAITDPAAFAADVRRAMLVEREDGSSLLSDFLDHASNEAVDDGSEACDYEQRIATGEFSPLETWSQK